MKAFWLCFVPLFVAVDALGVLPMFMNLTSGLDDEHRRRTVRQSVATAAAVALAFLAVMMVRKGIVSLLPIAAPN